MIAVNRHVSQMIWLNNKRYMIAEPYFTRTVRWYDIITSNLEKFEQCQFGVIPFDYGCDDGLLPAVGSYIPVEYNPYSNNTSNFSSEWQVLGYNKSIPSRVKYKNGTDTIYVSTIGPGGLLSSFTTGVTQVYSDKTGETSLGTITAKSDSIVSCDGNVISGVGHTYGNNNPYDAPKTVGFDGKTWSFTGWNMTIQVKYSLDVKAIIGTTDWIFQTACFQGVDTTTTANLINSWSTSIMRTWLNGSAKVSG